MWYLYVLIKGSKPIYVGVTRSIVRRRNQHRRDKDFDILYVIKRYKKKEDAFCAENSIIRFNGLFDVGLINAKHKDDEYYGDMLKTK